VEKTRYFLKQFGILIIVGVVGIGVLIYGLWGEMRSEGARVEIIRGEGISENGEVGDEKQITVDVAGSVEKPGLYKLPSGSRIGDALVMAGGLSAKADREWVAKTINLAEVVKDGGKIYIANKNTQIGSTGEPRLAPTGQNKININTASMGELDSLMGIGEARAKLILDNRPYSNPADLVSKAKIPQSVYDKIKDLISIY
jgi:competence protein ComEA